ncbi:hypothetical protein F3H66_22260 [Serratia marcescens]|uniref:hypothetical protein n=1 Tax=Serratia marcescens TaxID=615 RepID=UPI00187E2987|nr:hypothetical protein [Serratia marcescens]MBE8816265.1 hypothetical protein [Serratia marcescens]
MSTEKLSELSKPAAFIVRSPRGDVAYRTISQTDADYIARKGYVSEPLYSQEYVSALLARIAELEQKERHNERQNVIDGLAGAGESWSDIEEYMVKWDEERRNG